jgi:hypothetical protein
MERLPFLIETLASAARGARSRAERLETSPDATPVEIAAADGFAAGLERAAEIAAGVGAGTHPSVAFWKGRA